VNGTTRSTQVTAQIEQLIPDGPLVLGSRLRGNDDSTLTRGDTTSVSSTAGRHSGLKLIRVLQYYGASAKISAVDFSGLAIAAVVAPALGVIATTLFVPWTGSPWTGSSEVATSWPARSIARFFVDSFERRTNQRLKAVTGDPQVASLVSLGAGRPHLLADTAPEHTPWLSLEKFNELGGVVVWRASNTVGTPPPDIAKRFPGLVPEVPRAFEWYVNGRQPLLRIGWAIVRPKTP